MLKFPRAPKESHPEILKHPPPEMNPELLQSQVAVAVGDHPRVAEKVIPTSGEVDHLQRRQSSRALFNNCKARLSNDGSRGLKGGARLSPIIILQMSRR